MMRRNCFYWIAILSCCAGCNNNPNVIGSGVSKSQSRSITDVQSIFLYGVGNLNVVVGHELSLKITADDNLLQYVKSDITDGVLRLGVGPGSYTWHDFPQMELTVPRLNSVVLEGQTQVKVTGLSVPKFYVTTSGQNLVILAGNAKTLVLNLEGQSTCDATQVVAESATVHSTEKDAQSTYRLRVTDSIDGELTGTSVLEYTAFPNVGVTVKTSGQASIRKSQSTDATRAQASKNTASGGDDTPHLND